MAGDPGRAERFHAVLAEYLREGESGPAPDERDFRAQHPEFAQDIEQFLADNRWFDEMAESLQTWRSASTRSAVSAAGRSSPAERDVVLTVSIESDVARPDPGTRRFGRYELLEQIGREGMGIVYRARESSPDRIVALKMILAGRLASPEEVKRFHRGAEAAAHLDHPNIVRIHEVAEHEGEHYVTMDYVRGRSLKEMVAQGPLPPKQAARYVQKIANAIHYAHQQGTYHRDLKPSNVLVDESDEPRIIDFGIARRLDNDPGLTKSTDLLGTVLYMSPEQAARRTKDVGPASDIYSIGATLYHLLTKRPPFRGDTDEATLFQVIHADPIPPRHYNPEIPRDLEAIVLKCLEKSPARRYPSAAALAEDLGHFLAGEPVAARPRGRLARSVRWVRGVPLVARLTGWSFHQPTPAQRRAQRVINISFLAAVLVVTAVVLRPLLFPPAIVIAGGLKGPGYRYQDIAEWLAPRLESSLGRKVLVMETGGSNDNLALLRDGDADLAPTHLGSSSFSDGRVEIVAPLYYGVVCVLVRTESGIKEFAQLRGKRISLGPPSLGMRNAAAMVLRYHGMDENDIEEEDTRFEDFLGDKTMDGAIVTVGPDLAEVRKLLFSGFRVLSLPNARQLADEEHLRFRIVEVTLPSGDTVTTVEAPVVLAARADAPNWLIARLLEAMYRDSADLKLAGLMSREEAVAWINKVPSGLHPAAKRFFSDPR